MAKKFWYEEHLGAPEGDTLFSLTLLHYTMDGCTVHYWTCNAVQVNTFVIIQLSASDSLFSLHLHKGQLLLLLLPLSPVSLPSSVNFKDEANTFESQFSLSLKSFPLSVDKTGGRFHSFTNAGEETG